MNILTKKGSPSGISVTLACIGAIEIDENVRADVFPQQTGMFKVNKTIGVPQAIYEQAVKFSVLSDEKKREVIEALLKQV